MKLVGYLRVSTEDKGQDPQRQRDVIQAWASREGHSVVEWVRDEGTSGATDPFQRQMVLEAIELAKEAEAEGIVVENIDRWTREGVEALFVSRFRLRMDHDGLRVVVANTPPGLTPALEEMFDGIMATVARMFRDRLREQIKSGIALAKRNGWPKGKPGTKPKPGFSPAERELVTRMVNAGHGVDLIALEVSRSRGAFDVADSQSQRSRRVGPTWVWQHIRSELPELRERLTERRSLPRLAIEQVSGQSEASP